MRTGPWMRQGGTPLRPTWWENVIIMRVMVVITGTIICFNIETTAYPMSVTRWALCSCSRVIPFNFHSSLMRWILLLPSFYNWGDNLWERGMGPAKSRRSGWHEKSKLLSHHCPSILCANHQPAQKPRPEASPKLTHLGRPYSTDSPEECGPFRSSSKEGKLLWFSPRLHPRSQIPGKS